MKILVGYTGFVGSNLAASFTFDKVFNSKNIEEAYYLNPELLVYAGLRAEKYLANTAPEADMEKIYAAEENIRKINPKKLVLISTVDVLKNPHGCDEGTEIETENLHAYGLNRYRLEVWVRENYPDALIIRLPALFGINLKKNFLYDFINVIPSMLRENKLRELSESDADLLNFYQPAQSGFYKCRAISDSEKNILKEKFKRLGFTALNFTDSRNVYQFYPLRRLWSDISVLLDAGVCLFHPATEPISAAEIYNALTGEPFENILGGEPVYYDFRTKYAHLFGGGCGYISSKSEIISEICEYVGKCK